MAYEIIIKDKKTNARLGVLKTKSGDIETPFFMPVATKAAGKYLTSEDFQNIGIKAVISNAFILSLRPGRKIVKKFGGVANFMKYNGITATDSGGFQMYSKKFYQGSNDKGVFFRNPISGEDIFMTPEENMKIQKEIGGDIAMCFDSMPLIEDSKESINDSVRKTSLWAERCKKEHDKLWSGRNKQLLFGIIQGGIHRDLREKSANDLIKNNFDGYSIGGLALGEPTDKEYKMIELVKSIIPDEKPCYLMGAGHPLEVVEAIARGVDMFDSRYPTQIARRGLLLTWKGKLNISAGRYKEDEGKIDDECDCFVCKTYDRAYLRHLLSMEEPNGMRLASYHNIYFMQKLIDKSKEAIKIGKFDEFRKKMRKIYIHKR